MGIEFVTIYVLAEKQEKHIKTYDKAYVRIIAMFDSIFDSPTDTSREDEVKTLTGFIQGDIIKEDIACERLLTLILSDDLPEEQKRAVVQIYESVRPIEIYKRVLSQGNPYEKAYSCRKIADFFGEEEMDNIRQYVTSKNRDLSYNAAMALSVLGDLDSTADYILSCERNYQYSHRIILELLENFSGDVQALAENIFSRCEDDYIRATVIKGISRYSISDFAPMYLEGMKSTNPNIKIASVKALGEIGGAQYEHELIVALHDKDWVVRCAAIKGLENCNTQAALEAVFQATKDSEWWVRNNAAKALVKMDTDLTYVESVLKGYDKYATDAVKYSLYRMVNMNGEEEEEEPAYPDPEF